MKEGLGTRQKCIHQYIDKPGQGTESDNSAKNIVMQQSENVRERRIKISINDNVKMMYATFRKFFYLDWNG